MLALAVIVIGTFMAIPDSSIVNMAIPKMMAVFNAGNDEIEWVLTSYVLTMALLMIGIFGIKRVLKFDIFMVQIPEKHLLAPYMISVSQPIQHLYCFS